MFLYVERSSFELPALSTLSLARKEGGPGLAPEIPSACLLHWTFVIEAPLLI